MELHWNSPSTRCVPFLFFPNAVEIPHRAARSRGRNRSSVSLSLNNSTPSNASAPCGKDVPNNLRVPNVQNACQRPTGLPCVWVPNLRRVHIDCTTASDSLHMSWLQEHATGPEWPLGLQLPDVFNEDDHQQHARHWRPRFNRGTAGWVYGSTCAENTRSV